MKTKHSYMFSFVARNKHGTPISGSIAYNSEQLLELGIDEIDEYEMNTLGKVLEKRYEYTNVMVLGVTKLPMKVKR